MPQSKKAAFVRHVDPDVFIRKERIARPWMRHSVALLIISPRVDQVVLALPQKAADRGASHVRVVPQRGLSRTDTVTTVAAHMARGLLTLPVSHKELVYLGSGRGNAYRGQTPVKYGKGIHWVGLRRHQTARVFDPDCEQFQFAHWCSANHLLAMDTHAMSERKYILTLQALTAFNALGAEGKIIRKARQRLAA